VQDVDVLVVDDELKILEMYGKRLGWRGIPVRLAGGADEALAAVEEREPDVVILDVRMPGRDGLEVLAELRRRHPRVQVIMLTGHASVESARKGMELGAFDYLIKPVALEDLLAKVGEAAKAARA
jgi:DNA-binding NtrC family response regulator